MFHVLKRGSAAAVGGMALAAAFAVAPVADAAPSYDGLWSVVIVTQQGICDTSYRYPVRIVKGAVVNAGSTNVEISGAVQKNGAVVVHVSSGDKSATGTGRLAGASGGGSWSGGNGACSGVWQAERRG
ncbi:MAG: hypothetical protein IT537_22310 [Hyphomicrobiales bacterium]|nr:hypothetical protein [Hyphomicrobiales bacterium]